MERSFLFERSFVARFLVIFLCALTVVGLSAPIALAIPKSKQFSGFKSVDKAVQAVVDDQFILEFLRPIREAMNLQIARFEAEKKRRSSEIYRTLVDAQIEALRESFRETVSRVEIDYYNLRRLNRYRLYDELSDTTDVLGRDISALQNGLAHDDDVSKVRAKIKTDYERVLMITFLLSRDDRIALEMDKNYWPVQHKWGRWKLAVSNVAAAAVYSSLLGIAIDGFTHHLTVQHGIPVGVTPAAIVLASITWRLIKIFQHRNDWLKTPQEMALDDKVSANDSYFWTMLERRHPELKGQEQHWKSLLERYRCEISLTDPST